MFNWAASARTFPLLVRTIDLPPYGPVLLEGMHTRAFSLLMLQYFSCWSVPLRFLNYKKF